jgi:integrase
VIRERTTSTGEKRFDARFRGPDGRVRGKTFTTRRDARDWLARQRTDRSAGTWIDPARGRITFAQWWEQWWPTTVDLRASTRARDESYARSHILPAFGPTQLARIDHAGVQAWVAELRSKGLAPATVVKAAQILSKVMAAAVRDRAIPVDPTRGLRLPTIERPEMRFLNPTDVATLADAIDQRYRAFVILGAYSGLRLGELAGLRRDRLDLVRGQVNVVETLLEVDNRHSLGPPKTRAGRRAVPLPRTVVAELERHAAGIDPTRLVFTAPEGGPLRASLFRTRTWYPAVERAGLAPLRIHDLRHTAVALWIAAGASPKEIATRAGHTSVVTVLDRYGHLLPGYEDRVNDALDAMFETAEAAPLAEVRAMDARSTLPRAAGDDDRARHPSGLTRDDATWARRDSNPRHLPCKGSALAS